MSAIAGIWSFDEEVPVSSACRSMLQALPSMVRMTLPSTQAVRGRGPLPSAPSPRRWFDQQPLSAGSATSLVADIRLDNRDELVQKLDLSNHQTTAMADSDLLLAAWQRWQEQCVEHLSGAFSFAVWNQQDQHLFLARDHTGERPLCYLCGQLLRLRVHAEGIASAELCRR